MDGHERPTAQKHLRKSSLAASPRVALKGMQEYAGLPGSSEHVQFLKSTTQTQLSRALYPGSNIVRSTSRPKLDVCFWPALIRPSTIPFPPSSRSSTPFLPSPNCPTGHMPVAPIRSADSRLADSVYAMDPTRSAVIWAGVWVRACFRRSLGRPTGPSGCTLSSILAKSPPTTRVRRYW